MLFGDEHVKRYQETGGDEGYEWQGTTCLLLTTTGRKSGEERTTPLIFREKDGHYLIVASKGGAPEPPAWYLNLEAKPEVKLQVKDDVFTASARDASADEQADYWDYMAEVWPQYNEYQEKTDRQIPVVVLDRA